MKEKINRTLEQLIGLELTRTTRAANMECLKFGQQLINDKVHGLLNIGQFGIHLQCPWRITKGQEILIGSFDLYDQADQNAKYDPDFNWDRPDANLRDKKLNELIRDNRLTVEKIVTDDFGGFEITFTANVKLMTFPANSLEYEYWRLLDNRPKLENHFVVSGEGIWQSE
jgi:hypothetical protein